MGIADLIKYLDVNYPNFLWEIFENNDELFNNQLIPTESLFKRTLIWCDQNNFTLPARLTRYEISSIFFVNSLNFWIYTLSLLCFAYFLKVMDVKVRKYLPNINQ